MATSAVAASARPKHITASTHLIVLVSYDVSTIDRAGRRRLRRIARCCQDFGQRVQYSVFECAVGDKEWAALKALLLSEMESKQDSLRFYFLDEAAVRRVEHHGVIEPGDVSAPVVV